jgi:hypothetical protein
MKKRIVIRICLVALAVPIAAALLLIVIGAFSGGSAGGTLATGRSVMTHSDSIYLSSELRGDTATIKTDGKTIVVGPTHLLIDGAKVATINEAVADVQVRVNNGAVAFVADGRPIKTNRQ